MEDWLLKIDNDNVHWSKELARFKTAPKDVKVGTQYGTNVKFNYLDLKPGDFIIPKGSILRLDNITMHTVNRRRYRRPNYIIFSIQETSLEREDNPQTSPYMSRRSKKRNPVIKFRVSPELFNNIEFEYTV